MVAFLRMIGTILASLVADFAIGKVFSFGSNGAKAASSKAVSNVVLQSKRGVGGKAIEMIVIGGRAIPVPKISGLFVFLKNFFMKHKKLSKFTFALLVIELFTQWPSEFLKDGISNIGEFFSGLSDPDYKDIIDEDDLEKLDKNGINVINYGDGDVSVNGYKVDLDGSGEVSYKEYRVNKRVNELVMSLDHNFVELVRLAKQYDFDPFDAISYFGR